MVTPQFLPVSGDTLSLSALTPVGVDVDDYAVEIQRLDVYGLTAASYTWIGGVWCDDNEDPVENVTISVGQGLWVFDYTGTSSLQSAGKVGTSDVVVELNSAGGIGVGNPFPITVALDGIVPVGEGVDDYTVEIQLLDEYGLTQSSFTWIGGVWCDDNEDPVENVTFEPGQGLWVFAYADDCALQIPAPEL